MCLSSAISVNLAITGRDWQLLSLFLVMCEVQSYWSGIVNELWVIFGVPIELDPMCLLLGLPDGHIMNTKHKSLVNLLTIWSIAARNNILLFWMKDAAPTKKWWHNLTMECIPNDHILRHSSVDAFYKVLDPYWVRIGPTLSLRFLNWSSLSLYLFYCTSFPVTVLFVYMFIYMMLPFSVVGGSQGWGLI